MVGQKIKRENLARYYGGIINSGEWYLADKADLVMDALELQHKADAELIAADHRNMEQMKERIKELEDKVQMHDFFWDGCGKTWRERGLKNTIGVAIYVEDQDKRIKELEERIAHANRINKTLGEGLKDREARIKELEEQLACSNSNLPKEAYAVMLKIMDSHCLVGGKIFIKETDAETLKTYATHKAQRILDIVKVKILDNYEAPKETT